MAQAMIMTDRDNNQITAFHLGAMMQAHIATRIECRQRVSAESSRRMGAMPCSSMQPSSSRQASLRVRSGPGPAHVQWRWLTQFIEQATWVTVNDYEGKNAVRPHRLVAGPGYLPQGAGLVVTLGAEGWRSG